MHDLNNDLQQIKPAFQLRLVGAKEAQAKAQATVDWVNTHESTDEVCFQAQQRLKDAKAEVRRWEEHIATLDRGLFRISDDDRQDREFMAKYAETIGHAAEQQRLWHPPRVDEVPTLPAGTKLKPNQYTAGMILDPGWVEKYPELVVHLRRGTAEKVRFAIAPFELPKDKHPVTGRDLQPFEYTHEMVRQPGWAQKRPQLADALRNGTAICVG